MKIKSSMLPVTDVLKIVEDARLAEHRRDIEAMREILSPVWSDSAVDPIFDEYPSAVGAELYRIVGGYLNFYGYFNSLKDFQIRAKDLLTKAVDVFKSLNLDDKAAETNVLLAMSYWHTGEWQEFDAILKMIEIEYAEKPRHPVFLQAQINRLIALNQDEKFSEAQEIVKNINSSFALTTENHLKTMFHNQAGMLFEKIGKWEDSILHFSEVIQLSKMIGSDRNTAIALNNLACVYRSLKEYPQAHRLVSEATAILQNISDQGVLPYAFDSRALICLDEEKPLDALHFIDKALAILGKGEHYKGLIESMWTKCRCLFALDREFDAHLVYAELQSIAREKIGEVAVEKYAKALQNLTHPVLTPSLKIEEKKVRQKIVRNVLVAQSANLTKAAEVLGCTHQNVSRLLNTEMTELYQDPELVTMGLVRAAPRGGSKSKSEQKLFDHHPDFIRAGSEHKEKIKKIARSEIKRESVFLMKDLHKKAVSLPFDMSADDVEYIYVSEEVGKCLGLGESCFVAYLRKQKYFSGEEILAQNSDGQLICDHVRDDYAVLFLTDQRGNPFVLDELTIFGIPVGFVPVSESEAECLNFRPFGDETEYAF